MAPLPNYLKNLKKSKFLQREILKRALLFHDEYKSVPFNDDNFLKLFVDNFITNETITYRQLGDVVYDIWDCNTFTFEGIQGLLKELNKAADDNKDLEVGNHQIGTGTANGNKDMTDLEVGNHQIGTGTANEDKDLTDLEVGNHQIGTANEFSARLARIRRVRQSWARTTDDDKAK